MENGITIRLIAEELQFEPSGPSYEDYIIIFKKIDNLWGAIKSEEIRMISQTESRINAVDVYEKALPFLTNRVEDENAKTIF